MEDKLEEWKQKKEEQKKYVEQELKEYEENKNDINNAIYANSFRLDDKYKKKVIDMIYIYIYIYI